MANAEYHMDTNEKISFKGTIIFLKEKMGSQNISYSDNDFARKLNISEKQFQDFFVNDNAPKEIISLLYASFNEYLKNITISKISTTTYVHPSDPNQRKGS
ncbi:MAG TPA: hypothetical protein VM802_19070 [Chitinophaga sp.]|uniref:hypothetical protein n=1 Tax=Chitinophaga sp. TaxID=1869181 RepID=UPI002C2A2EF9|nr:hypothetical protein [Chitinophaga sp.]HVI46989.1 hypothetical protein [Chitinophaga sp.]